MHSCHLSRRAMRGLRCGCEASEWNSLVRAEFRSDLQAQLGLHQEAELVESHVNVHAGDTSVVVDLKGPEAASAAQQLARIVADGIETGGGVLKRVERSVGVQQHARRVAFATFAASQGHGMGEPVDEPRQPCHTRDLHTAHDGWRCRMAEAAAARWHGRPAMSEEDADEEEEEEMDVGGRTSSRSGR